MTRFDAAWTVWLDELTRSYGAGRSAECEALLGEPARRLSTSLASMPEGTQQAALDIYLRLAAEAVEAGHLREGRASFMARLWLDWVPSLAAKAPPAGLAESLIALWNIADGAAGHARWVDLVLAHEELSVDSLSHVERAVDEVWTRLFAMDAMPDWSALEFDSTLNTREHHESFLPGEMHLLGPCTVCVHDRRTPGVQLGVHLLQDGSPRVLGPIPCAEAFADDRPVPELDFLGPDIAKLGETYLHFPQLAAVHRSLVGPGGFVLTTAKNSQWLWVASCA